MYGDGGRIGCGVVAERCGAEGKAAQCDERSGDVQEERHCTDDYGCVGQRVTRFATGHSHAIKGIVGVNCQYRSLSLGLR